MSSPSQFPEIFISYRHGDAAGYTLLLHQELVKRFGHEHIFIDNNIPPGEDWYETVKEAASTCKALIVVIGKEWFALLNQRASTEEQSPDYLRMEILTALRRKIKIFPILVDGARMPEPHELPPELADLTVHQYLEVGRLTWKWGFDYLIQALEVSLATNKIESLSEPTGSVKNSVPRSNSYSLSRPKRLFDQFKRRGVLYWITILSIILIGVFVGNRLDETEFGLSARYNVYRVLQKLKPTASYPQETALVLIGDDEYWRGELGGRKPLKRDYLADLLRAVDYAQPAVIALDFDFRSPTPDGSIVEFPQYEAETKELLEVIKNLSSHRPIILPKTIYLDDADGTYKTESDIYNGFDFGSGNVRHGFIALPDNVEKLPLRVTLKDGSTLDSFSEAIVRAYRPDALKRLGNADTVSPFASYLKPEYFTTLTASEVLGGIDSSSARKQLGGKVVIIGGSWHTEGYGRGPVVDSYKTPVGRIGGNFIHANYTEAILDQRTYSPVKVKYLLVIECLLALVMAFIFALSIQPFFKLGLILLLSVLLVFFSYISWQTLNLMYSFFIPIPLLILHLLFEQISEWRLLARARLKETWN